MTLPAADLQVFAAASLTDVLRELTPAYEQASGDKLSCNFAGSSVLERQIEEGAPADLFLSADEAKMDLLEKKNLLLPSTRRNLLTNSLVIVVSSEGGAPIQGPNDLAAPAIQHIALAQPETVPAGIYAKQYLQKLGLWDSLSAKIVPTENVRAALAAVEAGNAEAALVYRTDAQISKKVRVAYSVPPGDTPPIVYPLAALKASSNPDAARRLLAFLESPAAAAVFEKYGFGIAQ